MAQNPFYVDEGQGVGPGLSGLANTLQDVSRFKMLQSQQQRQIDKENMAQQRFQDVQAAAMKAFDSQNPDEIARASVQYPEITQMLKDSAGLKDEVQNRDALNFTRTFATAAPQDRPALYQQRIEEIQKRGGDPTHTLQSFQAYMQNPEAETRNVISYWAGIDPKGYSVYSDQQKAQQQQALAQQKFDQQQQLFNQAEAGRNARASERNAIARANGGGSGNKQTAHMQDFQQYQQLKQTDPEAAKAFGQAAGFVSKEGRELAPGVQTRLAKTIDSAVSAENNVGKYSSLADEIEKSNISGGYFGGTFSEKMKELTGSQDAITDLRREVNGVKASQATANLPPGSASDADVRLAMGPFPTDNANKSQLASWLRGLSKLQQINADFHNFKADYISNNGTERGMLQAWKTQGRHGVTSSPASQPTQSQAQPSAAASSGGWEIVQ